MVVNWDQTGVRIVPSGNWTMEKKRSCQVAIAGLNDKREIIVLLAVNMLGETLPSQVIYQATTDRCHARYDFPDSWNITHTASHWSTESTIFEYLEKVVDPYFVLKRQELGLLEKHHGLLIVDVFKAHQTDAVRKFLDAKYISVLYMPAYYTDNLQPLDLTVNKSFTEDLRQSFQNWYGDQVRQQLDKGTSMCDITVDLRLSSIKNLHAGWIVHAYKAISERPRLIRSGFSQVGLCIPLPLPCIASAKHSVSVTTPSQSKKVKSYDQRTDDLCNDASVALIVEYFKSVISYALPSQFCQSRLNGRNGSNACTVISICVATRIMLDCVQVPDSGTVEPSQQTIRAFVVYIEEGNKHYDSAGCRGFLSVYGAIESACSDMNVTIARGGDFGVWNYDQFKQDLLTIRDRAVGAGTVHTGVLVMPSHFSVAIAFDPRKLCLAVFDSHSHHGSGMKLGASIAVASLDDAGILHMAEFLDFALNGNGLANGTMKGADIILIR